MIEGSNTIHVVLPPGMGLHAATTAFGQFGDIGKVEVLPSDMPTAIVSFFDVRAAIRAMEMIGADWCWPGVQCGDRTVRLPGTMQLSQDDYARMSGIRQDPRGDGFVVEFFDVRDAARVNASCRRKAQAAKIGKAKAQLSNLDPVYVLPSTSLPAVASNEAAERSVLIQGLPHAMCSSTCFEAMLEQAGLSGDVVSHNIRPGSPCGEAVVKVACEGAVERCIKHFHERVWDLSGTPVSATKLAPPPGLQSAEEAPLPSLLPAKRSEPLLGLPIPSRRSAKEAVLVPPPGLEDLCATKEADSEASTDAGASESGEYQDECLGEGCSIVVA